MEIKFSFYAVTDIAFLNSNIPAIPRFVFHLEILPSDPSSAYFSQMAPLASFRCDKLSSGTITATQGVSDEVI
jgi:hypothetical protein